MEYMWQYSCLPDSKNQYGIDDNTSPLNRLHILGDCGDCQ